MLAMLNVMLLVCFYCVMVWYGFGFACDATELIWRMPGFACYYYAIHVKADARTHLVGAGEICSGKTS